MTLTRRAVMASAACFAATAPTAGLSQSSPAIHVLKDPNCGCCTAWIEILKENGFKVTTERSFGTAQEVFANTVKTNEAIGALAKGQFEKATAQATAEVEKVTKAASKK